MTVKGDSVAVCSVLLDLSCSWLCDDIEFSSKFKWNWTYAYTVCQFT